MHDLVYGMGGFGHAGKLASLRLFAAQVLPTVRTFETHPRAKEGRARVNCPPCLLAVEQQ